MNNSIKYIFESGNQLNETSCNKIYNSIYTERYKQQVTDALVRQVSVALMVSAETCTQVVQGSNPTDGWKIIRSATAFSAVAFKMILRAPVRVPVHFIFKKAVYLQMHSLTNY